MSCNCKNGDISQEYTVPQEKQKLNSLMGKYIVKILGFFISLLFLPFILIAIVWFMFDVIVLNKNVDLKKIISRFIEVNKLFEKKEEDDGDDDYPYEEEDLTLINVEEITNNRK